MNIKELFEGCAMPAHWTYAGTNHVTEPDEEGEERVVSYGLVFDDKQKGVKIRFCYLPASERYVIVERKQLTREKFKYTSRCDYRKDEVKQLNEFIRENY